ncbi:MAG: SDR family oxidoreductase [Pseudomonadota bacterium]
MTVQSKTALVIGASGGIGSAVLSTLRGNPSYGNCFGLSRRDDGLDVTREATLEAAAKDLSGHQFDLIFIATGVLATSGGGPEKSFKALNAEAMSEAIAVNAIGPALAIKHFAPLLARDRRAVFAALSARVGSIGDNRLGGWIGYRASKSALNQIMRCAAIEFGRTHKQAVFAALHPGTIETGLSSPFARGRFTARPEEAAARLLRVLDQLEPEESGGFFAYDGDRIEW